jgi:hypothetical protein
MMLMMMMNPSGIISCMSKKKVKNAYDAPSTLLLDVKKKTKSQNPQNEENPSFLADKGILV